MTESGTAPVASSHRSGADATSKVVDDTRKVKPRPVPVLQRDGRATRYDTYLDADRRAESFAGVSPDARMTTARVVGLILRSGDALGVGPATRVVLAAVVERVYDADRWRSGDLHVSVSTQRLALEVGICERQIRRHLALLEANGWLIRRYAYANRRLAREALDLRPLGARLDELVAGAASVDAAIELHRRRWEAQCDDTCAVAAVIADIAPVSTSADENDRAESTSLNPPSIDGVQAQHGLFGAPDRDNELVTLMVAGSGTLQHSLGAADLDDPDPVRIVRAVSYIAEQHGIRRRIDPALWNRAIRTHGFAALAAVLIAIERPGVRDPAAYLAGMLRRPRLRETVVHSLRLIDRPIPSRVGEN